MGPLVKSLCLCMGMIIAHIPRRGQNKKHPTKGCVKDGPGSLRYCQGGMIKSPSRRDAALAARVLRNRRGRIPEASR